MKTFLITAFTIASMLFASAVAETDTADIPPATRSVMPMRQDGVTKIVRDSRTPSIKDDKIVVDVWSQTPSEDKSKLSQGFAAAGLSAATKMQSTQRRIEQSIKRGFPLGEFWIQVDFDEIDDLIRLATLATVNDADRQALGQLQGQRNQLKNWTDWLIQQNREVRLANYYISPETLNNDETFQSSVACTKFLLSIMTSRDVSDDASCR